jgi:hypothetical protein
MSFFPLIYIKNLLSDSFGTIVQNIKSISSQASKGRPNGKKGPE